MKTGHIYEKAVQLVGNASTLALSIIDIDGYPKVYAMEKVISEDLNKVIFITKKDSNKVRALNINNKCCLEVHTEEDSVCLKGNIQIQEDDEIKIQIFPYEYIKRLEKGDMQRYCLLIFSCSSAYMYIDGTFDTMQFVDFKV